MFVRAKVVLNITFVQSSLTKRTFLGRVPGLAQQTRHSPNHHRGRPKGHPPSFKNPLNSSTSDEICGLKCDKNKPPNLGATTCFKEKCGRLLKGWIQLGVFNQIAVELIRLTFYQP